jgi:hypothetical protein
VIVTDTATNMKEGARKAPSFALWGGVIAGIIVLASGSGVLLFQGMAQAADPISPAIARGYADCHTSSCRTGSLIPEIFTKGETRSVAEQRLATAGYENRDGFYAKPAPSDVPGCKLNYYVVPRYDTTDVLIMAFGEVASTC